MPQKSAFSLLLALSSGLVTVELIRWTDRAAIANGFGERKPLRLLDWMVNTVVHMPDVFSWISYSWVIGALIMALPIALARRSATSILVLELFGFAFGFLHVLWDVGTMPSKFDLRLLHPGAVATLLVYLCGAATLASLVLAFLCNRPTGAS